MTARIDYLSRSADVEIADTVLTTGSGKVFPKGLLVGWVTRVDRVEHGLYQEVMIDPAAPLLALDEVLVVKAFGPEAEITPASLPASLPVTEPPPAALLDPNELESTQPVEESLP